MGYMAQSGVLSQWENRKLVSRGPGCDSRLFLFFSCVYQELNKRYIKTQKSKY